MAFKTNKKYANKFVNILMQGRAFLLLLVLFAAIAIFPQTGASIMWGLCVGWIGHIFQDLFNVKGCPLMYPFSSAHFHIVSFKTRHWSEYVFLGLWEGGCLAWALLALGGTL